MTRAERRKFKYAVIRNITKNPKLAETYKDASNERIFEELNIVIPKRVIEDTGRYKTAEDKKAKYEVEGFVYKYKKQDSKYVLQTPKLTELDKDKKTRYERMQDNKVQYAIKRGIPLEDAQKLRNKTYKQIDKAVTFETTWKPTKVRARKSASPLQDKIDQYSNWAREDEFPPNLVRMARTINLEHNLDINETYGFTVMYYAYIYNREPEFFIKQMSYNRASEVVEYKENMKY